MTAHTPRRKVRRAALVAQQQAADAFQATQVARDGTRPGPVAARHFQQSAAHAYAAARYWMDKWAKV